MKTVRQRLFEPRGPQLPAAKTCLRRPPQATARRDEEAAGMESRRCRTYVITDE